jgi:hypothetical protein
VGTKCPGPQSTELIEDHLSQHLIKSQTVDLVKPPDGGGVIHLTED